jgi:GWxTD domain-containing protein
MDWYAKKFLSFLFAVGLILSPLAYLSAAQEADPHESQQPPSDQSDKTAKGRQKSDNALKKELGSQYKKWLDEDVAYIITPEERHAFLHLATNEEREQFIEAFWQRRNPDPDSPENTYKEEHYRRIAYANEHYASGIPGWKTDRGKIYIIWGAPDEVDYHAPGGTYDRPFDQGGGQTTTYGFEEWRYRYLEGMGENIELEFVDPSGSGEFHLTMDPSEKDALLYVPGAGLTLAESMGQASKAQRFNNTDGTHDAASPGGIVDQQNNEFNRIEQYANIFRPPPVKFKDLEAVVSSRLVRDQIKFDYRYDFLRITSDTVLVPITVQIPVRQLSFQQKDGVDSATMDVFARITSLGGRVIQTFEDTLRADYPDSLLQQSLNTSRIYQKAVPLSPGLYRLDIVIKDVNSGNVGVVNARLAVPRFQDDQLSSSSLILADNIERVSTKDISVGQFVLGDVKVRPRLDGVFSSADRMGVFLQVYNLKVDDTTHKPDASVEVRVTRDKETAPVLKVNIPDSKLPAHGEEMTLEESLAVSSLEPGKYRIEVAVTDNLAKQTITPGADFTVKAAPLKAAVPTPPPGR